MRNGINAGPVQTRPESRETEPGGECADDAERSSVRRRRYGNTGHQGAEEQQSTRLPPSPLGSGDRREALEQLGVVGQQASEPAQVAGKRGHPDVEQDVALPEALGDLSTA